MEGEGSKGKGQPSRVFTQRHVKVKSSRSHSWPRPASGLTSERGCYEGRKGKGRGTEPHLIDVSLVKCSNSLAVTPPCDNATCDYSARVQLLGRVNSVCKCLLVSVCVCAPRTCCLVLRLSSVTSCNNSLPLTLPVVCCTSTFVAFFHIYDDRLPISCQA